MCGGIYEEDLVESELSSNTEDPRMDKTRQTETEQEHMRMGSGEGGMMGDMKFTTAGQYMDSIEESVYPGKCAQ